MNQILLISGAIFFICMIASFILWIPFFKSLKNYDKELHEKVRFKWKEPLAKNYGNFVFKKEFYAVKDIKVVGYSKALYWLGHIGQWGFNIFMLIAIIDIIVDKFF